MTFDMPAEINISRVKLRVGDLNTVQEFYETIVGLEVLYRGEDQVVLGTEAKPLLVLDEDKESGCRGELEAGLYHTAFRVPNRTALTEAWHRINECYQLDGATDHGASESLYLSDPEGNGVEISHDRPRQHWPRDIMELAKRTKPLNLDDLAAEATGGDSVPSDTDIGHVHLEVTDLLETKQFYHGLLGFNVQYRSSQAVFLAAGDYHHHFGANTWQSRSKAAQDDTHGLAAVQLVVPESTIPKMMEQCTGRDICSSDKNNLLELRDPDNIRILISRTSSD